LAGALEDAPATTVSVSISTPPPMAQVGMTPSLPTCRCRSASDSYALPADIKINWRDIDLQDAEQATISTVRLTRRSSHVRRPQILWPATIRWRPRAATASGMCSLSPAGRGWRSNVFHLPVRASGDGGEYATVSDVSTFWRACSAGRRARGVGPDQVGEAGFQLASAPAELGDRLCRATVVRGEAGP
jgi:hypothetical protein